MKKNRFSKRCIFTISILIGLLIFAYIYQNGQNSKITSSIVSFPAPVGAAKQKKLDTGTLPRDNDDPGGVPVLDPKASGKFKAGGREWSLSFEDPSIPEESKRLISADLNLVFGHLPRFEIDMLVTVITMSDGKILDRRIRFEGDPQTRVGNKIFQAEGFNCQVRGGSDTEVYIPKLVSEAYLKSITLVTVNKDAVLQLEKFLRRMSRIIEIP